MKVNFTAFWLDIGKEIGFDNSKVRIFYFSRQNK